MSGGGGAPSLGGGGGAGGGAGSRGATTARGGIAMNFERQKTSKQRLRLEWNFPVFRVERSTDDARGQSATVTGSESVALTREEAIKWVANDDRRPMLVLRECDACGGTDDALLNRRMNNEKTLLLATWFRCIKLPTHVMKANHPFHNLFAGEHPPHLFLCRHDGTGAIPMTGGQSQAELWQAMTGLLRECYTRDAEVAIKEWLKLFTKFDHCDTMEQTLAERFDEELEKNGPKSLKLAEIKADIERIRKEREKALAKEKEVRDLGLKPLETAKTEKAEKAEGTR